VVICSGAWVLLLLFKSKSKPKSNSTCPVTTALPKGTNIKKLRIDAAGYQASIIDYCFEHDIEFSIRAKMCQSLKGFIANFKYRKTP
jgi:hypothetical protein